VVEKTGASPKDVRAMLAPGFRRAGELRLDAVEVADVLEEAIAAEARPAPK
jgi:hypothetical protein